jgi:Periplasmic copper-binding protein (NosD)
MRRLLLTIGFLVGGGVLASCGDDGGASRVISVPGDVATISEAVQEAESGDIVSIAPGIYHESVKVDRRGITIRGEDRNTVILDGKHDLANGFLVTANEVAVENLTVHSFTQNGVVFNGIEAASGGKGVDKNVVYGAGDAVLSGYRTSYITAYNNGLYGIYAFASRNGLIEHTYVSGHPDSGIYIGQCKPCNAVVRNSTAETNAIGYYGTNASGSVYVIDSTFAKNRLGIAPNSQEMEKLAPQEETVVAGNLVIDNDNPQAPKIAMGFSGGGIAVGGGTRNMILRNRVEGHKLMGIGVVSMNEYLPENNRIEGNVLAENAVDLLYARDGAPDAAGNCFTGNTFATSIPENIETLLPCDAISTLAEIPKFTAPPGGDGPDYRDIPAPGPQTTMPAAALGAIGGSAGVPVVDLAAIRVPKR